MRAGGLFRLLTACGAPTAALLPALLAGPVGADDRPTGTNRVVATHGAWSVVIAETNRGPLCYAAGTPALRVPKDASTDGAFVFVTTRPDEQVRDEFAAEFGFEPSAASLEVGGETFALATRGDGAWIQDPADEVRLVAALRSNAHMTLRVTRAGGKDVVDSYRLDGFAPALAQARRQCADGALSN